MKTNLSSQITLTRIPERFYRPDNAYEHSVLTRFEKIPTNIYESADKGALAIATEIATEIRKKQAAGEKLVLISSIMMLRLKYQSICTQASITLYMTVTLYSITLPRVLPLCRNVAPQRLVCFVLMIISCWLISGVLHHW